MLSAVSAVFKELQFECMDCHSIYRQLLLTDIISLELITGSCTLLHFTLAVLSAESWHRECISKLHIVCLVWFSQCENNRSSLIVNSSHLGCTWHCSRLKFWSVRESIRKNAVTVWCPECDIELLKFSKDADETQHHGAYLVQSFSRSLKAFSWFLASNYHKFFRDSKLSATCQAPNSLPIWLLRHLEEFE